MKKILITGANSYIGMSFENYMKQWPDKYQVDTVDMIDGSWRNMSFAEYDSVFHVAGIVHIKETKENAHLYYEINRDLAFETAKKVKLDGCKQFVYLSSMSVYGKETGVISKDTIPSPKTNYGISKLQAEKEIAKLCDNTFLISFLRPPMVYGNGCKGNYQALCKWAKKLIIFPSIKNKRSMVHIDKLCEYVKCYLDNGSQGVFFPQDDSYICTSEMVKTVAFQNSHRIWMTVLFNPVIYLFMKCGVQKVNKIFGNLIYETELLPLDNFDNERS